MPIYERGGGFQVSVGSGTNRYRENFATRQEAEEAELAEMLRRKREGATGRSAEPVKAKPKKTLGEAFDLTVKLKWTGLPSQKTQTLFAQDVVKELGADTALEDIRPEDIAEAIDAFEDKGNSGSTVNRKMSVLSVMFKTAIDHQWIDKMPKIPRKKEGKHRIRWLDEKEEAKLLSLCGTLEMPDMADFIITAVDTGFRRGELLRLEPRDYANGMLHLHAGETKNGDARAVPCTERVVAILERRIAALEGVPNAKIFGTSLNKLGIIRRAWDLLKMHLGLEDDPQFVVHMLRHTCASRLVQRGVPLAVVQRWMGHRHIQTTLRYAHLAPDSLLQARDALAKAGINHADSEKKVAANEF